MSSLAIVRSEVLKVFHAEVCGLIIRSVYEDEAVLSHPIFYLFSSAIEFNLSPAWRVATEEVTSDQYCVVDKWKSV